MEEIHEKILESLEKSKLYDYIIKTLEYVKKFENGEKLGRMEEYNFLNIANKYLDGIKVPKDNFCHNCDSVDFDITQGAYLVCRNCFVVKSLSYQNSYDDNTRVHMVSQQSCRPLEKFKELLAEHKIDQKKIISDFCILFNKFEEMKPPRRKFFNQNLTLFQLLKKHNLEVNEEDFPQLVNNKKIFQNDLCKEVFKELGWEYFTL